MMLPWNSLAELWTDFDKTVVGECPDELRFMLKSTFYAAGAATVALVASIIDERNEMDAAERLRRLEGLVDEAKKWGKEHNA